MKSVVVDPAAYDWEGDAPLRRSFASTVIYEMHVAGFTRHPSSGSRCRAERHICRHDREDPVPPGSRDHRGGAAADIPVRPAGLPGGPRQLLGLFAGIVLRPACRLQFAQGRPRPGRRVPRPRQGAPPRRHRGDPRRRLQPHRRRECGGTHPLLSAASPTKSTTSSTRTGRTTPITAAPATR